MQVAHSVATEAYPFEINRIGDVAGAEIIGLDLSEPIDTATRDAIIRAFLEHHVLVFRNQYLSKAIAEIENTESAVVTSSGMAAISSVILQLCSSGDNIISSNTVYGGTYALFRNLLPRFQIKTSFISMSDFKSIEKAINSKTKLIYCESMSNPLLGVSDIKKLSKIAKKRKIKLVVDNTFCPLIFTPKDYGADVVIHSITKFINGSSDAIGGVVCSDRSFIQELIDVNFGVSMLLGPTMDSVRSSNVLKNLRTLHIRIKQHSKNAMFLAEKFHSMRGLSVCYPGLITHSDHFLMKSVMNNDFGFGGLLTIDVGDREKANRFMEAMQDRNIGYLAVSLGFYKTLFTAPGSSTSSEISEDIPFLKLFIPFATSPIKLDILPLPKSKTTNITTIAICQNPILMNYL